MRDKVLCDGYVKLCRKLLEDPIFKDPEILRLYLYGILKANYKRQKVHLDGQEVTVEEGQFISGIRRLARDTGISIKKIRHRIALLEKGRIWALKRAHSFSLVTVRNCRFCQDAPEVEGTPKGTRRAHQGHTVTREGPSGEDRQASKKDKKDKNKYIECKDFETLSAFLSSLPEYLAFSLETRELILEFINRVRSVNGTKRITGGRICKLLTDLIEVKDRAGEESLVVGLRKCLARARKDGFDFGKRDPVAYTRTVARSHKAEMEQKRLEAQALQQREALRKVEGGKVFQQLVEDIKARDG